jgi:putative membrane-bound dehydrogenase-like protein
MHRAGFVAAVLLLLPFVAVADTPGFSAGEPKSPREELATFRVLKGFRVELVAAEPDVVDPVAIAFDERGRLYAAEMRGYPNAGVGTGDVHTGRVKLLEDRDGDGYYEHSTMFAEGLRFPTSVMPWRGGVLVGVAPDVTFYEDADGDGRSDRRRTLYTGFGLDNIQQLVNSLQFGLDNWVHACAGNNGGTVRTAEADRPAVALRGRGVRFRPDEPGSLEPTSGGGQFGLTADAFGRWFTATNSQHLRHIVLPDQYLRRNPWLAVSAVTHDIPDHGAACQVFRVSPFEPWRVERTRRRKEGSDARRFPGTELVPGGYATSACSPLVYTADLFPPTYRGDVFVCDPANNLIHRDRLVPNGATFVARRADEGCEFLASTDNWFRPVNLTVGPDGALYVVDFYREAIETPLSLPDDIKARLNLHSRGRGRIWRVVPEGAAKWQRPDLHSASAEALVRHLGGGNSWARYTAQRLLFERQDRGARPALEKLAVEGRTPEGRTHALWALRGLGVLSEEVIAPALRDPHPGVREQAARLAEDRLATSPPLRAAVLKLVDDAKELDRLGFQIALSLGEAKGPDTMDALAKLARRFGGDPWMQTAVLSSAGSTAGDLLARLIASGDDAISLPFLRRLAAVVGSKPEEADAARTLQAVADRASSAVRVVVLEGLGQGLQGRQQPLTGMWDSPPPALRDALEQLRPLFDRTANTARDDKAALPDRIAATELLAHGPPASGSALRDLLGPQQPPELQLAAVRALSGRTSAEVADWLLVPWSSYSPAVRREVLEVLFARVDRLNRLLAAVEAGKVAPAQLDPARLEQLRNHKNAAVRQRARRLLVGTTSPDRGKVMAAYADVLKLPADAGRGRLVFRKTCATCHRLEDVGYEVGPDLLAALRNKTPEGLLGDVLDPSREVDPRYVNYLVTTKEGQVLTGLIAAETASSVTLRRAEKAEDTVLRGRIDEIQATAKSVMPENLETLLSKQELADVIAYLMSVAAPK